MKARNFLCRIDNFLEIKDCIEHTTILGYMFNDVCSEPLIVTMQGEPVAYFISG
jgi:hypothetical protein